MSSPLLSEQGWQIAGWTMVYFLALGSGVAIIAGVVRFLMRNLPPGIRYAASLTVFCVLALLPLGIAIWLFNTTLPAPPRLSLPPAAAPAVRDLAREPVTLNPATPVVPSVVPQQPIETVAATTSLYWLAENAFECLPWLWFIGSPLTFCLLATGLIGAERLRRSGELLCQGPVLDAGERLSSLLELGRTVAIAISDRVATPVLVGIARPLILLPPAALTGWSPADLEMVLLHELAHVKRWDNLVNLAQRVVESALFFHPAVWLVSHWVRLDREDCCDAVVVAQTAKPQAYAELLVALASSSQPLAGLALARHPLGGRIRRILRLPEEPMRVSRGTLVTVGTVLLAILLVINGYTPATSTAEDAGGTQDQQASPDRYEAAKEELDAKKKEFKQLLEKAKKRPQIAEAQAAAAEAKERAEELARRHLEAAAAQMEAAKAQMAKDLAARRAEAASLFAKAEAASQERQNAKLAPGDKVLLRVIGALPDQPLHDELTIEPMGTIALGPAYGRVKIEGLDLLEAEQAIRDHLDDTLENPRLQLTLVSRANAGFTPTYFDPAMGPPTIQVEGDTRPTRGGTFILREARPQIAAIPPDDNGPSNPDVLQPGDQVELEVMWPRTTRGGESDGYYRADDISRQYHIESMGTIALGALQGRVKIAGNGLLEAEQLITDHLAKDSESGVPKVQLSLVEKALRNMFVPTTPYPPVPITAPYPVPAPAPAPDAAEAVPASLFPPTPADIPDPGPAPEPRTSQAPHTITYGALGVQESSVPPTAAAPKVVYDGKTFEQWRDQLQWELRVDKRNDCVAALEAFARAGHRQEEIADLLLAIAKEYDWSGARNMLQQSCGQAFLRGLPAELALKKTLEAADSDNPRLKSFSNLVAREILRDADEETAQTLKEKFPGIEPASRRGGGGFGGGGAF